MFVSLFVSPFVCLFIYSLSLNLSVSLFIYYLCIFLSLFVLGLYVFGCWPLFSNCVELLPVFRQFAQQPLQLALHLEETEFRDTLKGHTEAIEKGMPVRHQTQAAPAAAPAASAVAAAVAATAAAAAGAACCVVFCACSSVMICSLYVGFLCFFNFAFLFIYLLL